MTISTYIFIGCFVIFFAYWRISAMRLKPATERVDRLATATFRIPQILGLILLVWRRWWPDWLQTQVTPSTDAVQFAGCAVCVAGLALAIWSRRTLAGNWSSEVTFKQDHELVMKGPYRLMRHPIYTSFMLMLLGPVAASGRAHAWLGFAIMCLAWWIKLRHEERLLVRHFAGQYRDYQKRVKALVPFLI